jgi:hypothetical protein
MGMKAAGLPLYTKPAQANPAGTLSFIGRGEDPDRTKNIFYCSSVFGQPAMLLIVALR